MGKEQTRKRKGRAACNKTLPTGQRRQHLLQNLHAELAVYIGAGGRAHHSPDVVDYSDSSKLNAAATVDLEVLSRFSSQGYLYSAKVQMQTEMAPAPQLHPSASDTR